MTNFKLPAWLLACVLGAFFAPPARPWGQMGHSIVAELAQRRLSPAAADEVGRILGRGHSLAAIASWADDIREARPETRGWHFVNIPISEANYAAVRDCQAEPSGDCVVAELQRLGAQLRCGKTVQERRDALRFAVHLVGDIHQPLHTVLDEQGGNAISVQLNFTDLKCRRNCRPRQSQLSFHELWDSGLIEATAWDWGSYVERVESGWLASPANARRASEPGSPVDWANETHRTAQSVWARLPESRIVDDDYYKASVAIVDRQLGLAGLRLASFLNEAFGKPHACSEPR